MADKTENKVTNRKKIHFFREKKWIMAYWFKTSRKAQFTEEYLLRQWNIWWKGDFDSISDQIFQEIFTWIKDTVRTMTKDEIKKKRHDITDCRPMPLYIRQLANKKGYYVKKCSTRKHPLKVSGYAIFKKQKDKKAVYGKKFDLTVQQVIKILEAKEDK